MLGLNLNNGGKFMLKEKASVKSIKNLSSYQFDTSQYIIFKEGARRESGTGKLTAHKEAASQKNPDKK
jgi:hypothetical protein